MSARSWIILQYGDQFYFKNPCILLCRCNLFGELSVPAKYCQTENSQSEQKLTILGSAELKFLNVNKSW